MGWLREENEKLKEQVKAMKEEANVLSWYTKVMETGIDSKQMLKLYKKSKEKIEVYSDIRRKDEVIEKHIEYEERLNKDIQIFNSIIRVPRICYKFQKVLRKKYQEAEAQKKD